MNKKQKNEKPSSIGSRAKRHYDDWANSMEVANIEPPMPDNMLMDLTNACNHACVFCGNPFQGRKTSRISNELAYRILDEAYDSGVREVGFYNAGDPFMHKQLPDFTSYAKSLGYSYIYISTNGALASPERLRNVINSGMDSIKFSINAGSKESYLKIHGKDDWEKVIDNLKYVSSYRKTLNRPLKLFVTCVVTKQIKDEIKELEKLVSPLVDEVQFFDFHDQIGQMTAIEPLMNVGIKDRSQRPTGVCSNPFNRIHITSEGYLALCCVDYNNYVAVEDLKTKSLQDAWYSPLFKEIRAKHLDGDLDGTLCAKCWFRSNEVYKPINSNLAVDIHQSDSDKKQISLFTERFGQISSAEDEN